MHENPLVDRPGLLEKFPGKGGWTYVATPEVTPDPKAPFGWVVIRGWIDDYELKQIKLMPFGNGQLFLPVKAAIRKKLKKQVGDVVNIILFRDESTVLIPEEILDCFSHESPKLYQTFLTFTQSQQKAYLDWITGARKEETKVERIVKMMERLEKGLQFHDPD